MRKSISVICAALAVVVTLLGSAFGGETGHYVSGVEGIKAGTVPPPGLYYRMYNVFYQADKLKDTDGDTSDVDFDADIFSMVHRLVWVSNKKILGADYFASIIFPTVYTDIELGPVKDNQFGLGDMGIEPFGLAWHGPRYDAGVGLGVYVPTGRFDKNRLASPGKDFWTTMITLGGTYYLDAEKTWSASILSRYEIHSSKDHSDVRPGNDFHFEWGIGKTIEKFWDVGVSGYCHWQVTDDSGSDVMWDKGVHDRVYAIGPEISAFIPSAKLSVSLRYLWEFGAVDRSEGNSMCLCLTKVF
jgi:hypothetical protein